jgi:hypothetical protein
MEKHWSSRRVGDCPSGRARILRGNCAILCRDEMRDDPGFYFDVIAV